MTGAAPQVEVEHDGLSLEVRIGGLVHLHVLDTVDLFAIQSWHVAHRYFAIKLTSSAGAAVLLDYDDRGTWEAVLRGVALAVKDARLRARAQEVPHVTAT